MTITVLNSPHQSGRPVGVRPRCLVLHADASPSHVSTIAWLLHPDSKVSYHAIVGRDGSLTQLVPDARKAWHAGVSSFGGVDNVNDFSIGICFSNKNDGMEPYTSQAIAQGVELVAAKMRQFGIGLDCLTTHEQIARPMNRKHDPGVTFPLAGFIMAVRNRLSRP